MKVLIDLLVFPTFLLNLFFCGNRTVGRKQPLTTLPMIRIEPRMTFLDLLSVFKLLEEIDVVESTASLDAKPCHQFVELFVG